MQTKFFRAWLSPLCLAMLLLLPSAAFAAEQTVEADGYYTVGDGLEENHSTAKLRAKEAAKGIAAEQAAVLVEKCVTVKNHQLTASEIRTVAANVMKIKEEIITPEVDGNTIRYHCHIVAVVDDGSVIGDILTDRQKLAETVQKAEELRLRNEALAREIEELKRQYQVAKTNEERAALRREAQANERSFTAAQWVEQGNQAYDEKNYNKAIECYNKAIALDPGDACAYSNLGSAYGAQGDIVKAMEWLNKALVIDSDFADAYYNLGFAYYQNSDYNKAIENLNKAIALKSSFPVAVSYHILGNAYFGARNYDKAIELQNKAIAQYPGYADAYNSRGIVYARLGRKQEAKRDFMKACELEPNEAVYAFNLLPYR